MKRIAVAVSAAVFASAGAVSASPILLASFDNHVFRPGSAPAEPRVEFVLQLVGIEAYPMIGLGVFWEEGDVGSVDLSSATDPEFTTFADLATNGIDDILQDGVLWPTGGTLAVSMESDLLGGSPDLIGYELDFVRLIVRRVQFEPWIPSPGQQGVTVDYDLSYEFYGSLIPEPSTAILTLMAAVLMYCCRGDRTRRNVEPRSYGFTQRCQAQGGGRTRASMAAPTAPSGTPVISRVGATTSRGAWASEPTRRTTRFM